MKDDCGWNVGNGIGWVDDLDLFMVRMNYSKGFLNEKCRYIYIDTHTWSRMVAIFSCAEVSFQFNARMVENRGEKVIKFLESSIRLFQGYKTLFCIPQV